MKLFRRVQKKKRSRQEEERAQRLVLEAGSYENREVREAFLSGNCEVIAEAARQNLEIRKEYEVVTSYLSDIQRIDMMSGKSRAELTDCAQRLLNLSAERDQMKRIPAKITAAQRNALEPYQETMPEEIRKMEENESYQKVVQSDLKQLEAERASLDYEIEDIVHRSTVGRRLMFGAFGFVCVFICLLFLLQEAMAKDVQVPFLLTVAFGLLAAAYFFFTSRRDTAELRLAEKKRNRAVYLTNKVKIKYVNCTNLLEYGYEKFHVANAKELRFHWEESLRLQEEERRLAQADSLIDSCARELVQRLKEGGVQDADIWIYQSEALVDAKEMVEVRHRLNVRRQRLRQQIDYNNSQADSANRTLREFMEKHPEYAQEAERMLREHKLDGGS